MISDWSPRHPPPVGFDNCTVNVSLISGDVSLKINNWIVLELALAAIVTVSEL